MRGLLLPFLLSIAACNQGERNETVPQPAPAQVRPAMAPRLATLSGDYAGGGENRLCIVASGRSGRFGLVLGTGSATCSGGGTLRRAGNALQFAMKGDSSCGFAATIEAKSIVFPGRMPAGCSYYCGADGRLAGARFDQRTAGSKAASRTRDLVGEPLCTQG